MDTSGGWRIAYPIRIGYGYVSDTPWIRILDVSTSWAVLGRKTSYWIRIWSTKYGPASNPPKRAYSPCCPTPTPPRAAARPAPPRATRAATRGRRPPEQPPPSPATTSHDRRDPRAVTTSRSRGCTAVGTREPPPAWLLQRTSAQLKVQRSSSPVLVLSLPLSPLLAASSSLPLLAALTRSLAARAAPARSCLLQCSPVASHPHMPCATERRKGDKVTGEKVNG